MVISALGIDRDLGIDLEALDRAADPDIARRFFFPAETRCIMALPGPDRGAMFLKYWTLKEAWAKADGRGIAAGLDRMVFDLSCPGRIGWVGPDNAISDWQFFQFSPVPAAVAAVGTKGERPAVVTVYECIPFRFVKVLGIDMISSDPR